MATEGDRTHRVEDSEEKSKEEEQVQESTDSMRSSSSSVAMTTVFSDDKLPEGEEVVMFRVEGVVCDFLAPPSFKPISLTSNGT